MQDRKRKTGTQERFAFMSETKPSATVLTHCQRILSQGWCYWSCCLSQC